MEKIYLLFEIIMGLVCLFFTVFLITTIFHFLFTYVLRRSLKGENEILWIGGFRQNPDYAFSFGTTWPFGLLLIENNVLTLECIVAKKYSYTFKKDDIIEFKQFEPAYTSVNYIEIIHKKSEYPDKLCFATFPFTQKTTIDKLNSIFLSQGKIQKDEI